MEIVFDNHNVFSGDAFRIRGEIVDRILVGKPWNKSQFATRFARHRGAVWAADRGEQGADGRDNVL